MNYNVKEHNLYNSVLDRFPTPFVAVNEKGYIADCNQSFLDFIGFKDRHVSDIYFIDLLANKDKAHYIETTKNIWPESQTRVFDTRFRIKDGISPQMRLEITALSTVADVYDDTAITTTGKAIVIVIKPIDSSELSQLSEAENVKIQKLERERNSILSHISHELKTPLNAIMGFSELLLLEKSLSAEQLENIRTISNSSIHLNKLVSDLLMFSEMQSSEIEYNSTEVNLTDIIESAIEKLSEYASSQNVTLRYADFESQGYSIVDQQRLQDVIDHILANAIKYNKDNGTVDIILKDQMPESPQSIVSIHIRDTGHGLSDDDYLTVFQPMQRGKKFQIVTDGAGMGLTLATKHVQNMGGIIHCISQENIGTEFVIKLKFFHRKDT